MSRVTKKLQELKLRKHFVNSTTNDVYQHGDRMYCSKYSQTLSEILGLEIEHDYFNQSPFAEQIVAEMEETGNYRKPKANSV